MGRPNLYQKVSDAVKSVIHTAKAIAAIFAHNFAKALKEALKSPLIRKVVAFVLVFSFLLVIMVPVILSSLIELVIDGIKSVIDMVSGFFSSIGGFFGDLWDSITGGDGTVDEGDLDAYNADGSTAYSGVDSMMYALAGTSYAVISPAQPSEEELENMTFTEAMKTVLTQSSEVIECYLKQRVGDYKDLADTIAASYSTSNVTYDGVTYEHCNVSASVNVTSMPRGMGQKALCAYIAQTKDKNYPVSLYEWMGKRGGGSGRSVTIDGKAYTIPGYTGSFHPQYEVDELLADKKTDFSGSSLIDEIIYVSSVNKSYYITYLYIPIIIPDPAEDTTEPDDPETPTEPVEPTDPGTPAHPRPPHPGPGPIDEVQSIPGATTQTRAATRRIEMVQVPILNLNISVTVSYRDMDDIVYDTIGLWTGNETNYDATTLINDYGNIGDTVISNQKLLSASWTTNGKTYERLTFNQIYYYKLMSDFCGLFNPIHNAGGDGSDIIAVAEAEYQLYVEDLTLSGGDKYWSWYYGSTVGPHHDEAWCCLFLYWCADQCGYLTDDGCFGPTVYVNCRDVWNDFSARDETYTYASAPDYEPSPGDIVFYGTAACIDHVGFVKSYDKESDTITTIEGNTGDGASRVNGSGYRVVWSHTYPRFGYVYGYAHPNYPLGYYTDMLFMFYEASNDPACIAYDDGGGWSYGVTQFNTKSEVIDGFLVYLRDHYPDMFITYFADLPYDSGAIKTWSDANTKRLQTAWVSCANAEGEAFFNAQMEYTVIIVQPFFDYVMNGYGIDLKRSRALLEMSYCRSIQAGPSGAYNFFCQAFPDKAAAAKMSDTELINGFYDKFEEKWPSMIERLRAERNDVLALVVE